MAIIAKDIDATRFITLTDVVDIAQAAELKRLLVDAIGSSARVCVQVSGATAIDITTVQLLHAAVSHGSSAGVHVVVQGPWREEIRQSFSSTGVFPILASMSVESAPEGADVLTGRH